MRWCGASSQLGVDAFGVFTFQAYFWKQDEFADSKNKPREPFKLIEQGAFTLIRLLEPIEYRGYFFGARLMKSKPAEGLSMYATHVVERSGHYQREDQVQYESPTLIRPAQQMTCEHNSSIAAFDTVAESPVVMGLASPDSNQYQLVSSDLDWIVKTLASHDIACSTHNMMYNPEVEYIQCF